MALYPEYTQDDAIRIRENVIDWFEFARREAGLPEHMLQDFCQVLGHFGSACMQAGANGAVTR